MEKLWRDHGKGVENEPAGRVVMPQGGASLGRRLFNGVDPICGMEVDPTTAAATRTREGVTFYFCSAGCAKQFDADPHRFAHQDKGHSH